MPAATGNPYRKLPGRGAGSFTVCRLWLGEDHLLLVQASSIGERYKRFYFADIQAFLLRRTLFGYWLWLLAFALPFVGFGFLAVGALFSVPESEGWLALAEQGGAAACFGLLLGIHLFRGPTCSCQVRTAVQSEELPSLKRLRNARRVIAQLRPLIEAAQAPRGEPASTPA